ncbi:MAG: hypothetical protein QOE29_208 [Gaiellaceae bacterium]|jgi:exosome complex RNA-binding protein Csl4|nr:hypothetical protein [Gaiellaceae bacterium]MDX6515446.1 hypothetical protein [Gaiellaceae bacterium]
MDAHSITLTVGTLVVGVLMALSGLEKSALELKRKRRTCPSCGRTLHHGRTCGCSH